MKKKIALGMLLCVLLCACSPQNNTDISDTSEPDSKQEEETTSSPTTETNDSDAVQTRIAYYEHLVNELQQELLNIKTELYVSRVEYESIIAELEAGKITEAPSTEPDSPPTAEPSPSPVFRYTVENGVATITSYIGTDKQVEIPASIDGYPVRKIGDNAFMNKSDLTTVILPEGITSLGWFAFAGCVSLESITIPASVESISYGAFQNCNAQLSIACVAGSYAEQYARSYGIKTTS